MEVLRFSDIPGSWVIFTNAGDNSYTLDPNYRAIIEEIKSIEMLESHLSLLRERLAEYEDDLKNVSIGLERKVGKLDSLKRISILSLFKKLVGDHSKSLALYEQHYLDLSLEYNDLVKSIDLIEYEIDLIEKKSSGLLQQKEIFKSELVRIEAENVPLSLLPYRQLLDDMSYNIRLIKELEEAIKAGQAINRKFNSALRFTKKVVNELYAREKDLDKLGDIRINSIDKFHNHLVAINHAFIKYQSELEDVYREILNEETHLDDGPLASFMNLYRERLTQDLRKAKGLDYTYKFLKNYKEIIMTLNRSLRSDLKQCRKTLDELQQKEQEVLQSINTN